MRETITGPCVGCDLLNTHVVTTEDGESQTVTLNEDGSVTFSETMDCGIHASLIRAEELRREYPDITKKMQDCKSPKEDKRYVPRAGFLGRLGFEKIVTVQLCGSLTPDELAVASSSITHDTFRSIRSKR